MWPRPATPPPAPPEQTEDTCARCTCHIVEGCEPAAEMAQDVAVLIAAGASLTVAGRYAVALAEARE